MPVFATGLTVLRPLLRCRWSAWGAVAPFVTLAPVMAWAALAARVSARAGHVRTAVEASPHRSWRCCNRYDRDVVSVEVEAIALLPLCSKVLLCSPRRSLCHSCQSGSSRWALDSRTGDQSPRVRVHRTEFVNAWRFVSARAASWCRCRLVKALAPPGRRSAC